MKKKIFGLAIVATLVLGSGWNISQSMSEVALSDVSLANVEALADEMTDEQFSAIGCECADSGSCSANNGNTYTYAKRK
jgi:hypothetical protein